MGSKFANAYELDPNNGEAYDALGGGEIGAPILTGRPPTEAFSRG
jgi:hypothetical protein